MCKFFLFYLELTSNRSFLSDFQADEYPLTGPGTREQQHAVASAPPLEEDDMVRE
jgi:hypothetical protein